MYTVLAAITFALYVILVFPMGLIAWIIRLFSKKASIKFSYGFVNFGCHWMQASCGTKVKILNKENLIPDTPCLYIANHRSYFDVILTHYLVPNPTIFIAKKEFKGFLPMRMFLFLSGALTIDRSNPRQGLEIIHRATDYVTEGYSVFVFPEGTRSKVKDVTAEFKNGAFKIAQRTGCPIVPITIYNSSAVLEDNHKLKVSKAHVTVYVDKPVKYEELTDEQKKDIGGYIRSIIVDNYEKIKNGEIQ